MKLESPINKEQVIFGNDNIVIRKFISGIEGGRTLDCTGFAEKNILAGHVIIKKNGVYAPMPVNGDTYAALPDGAEYVGVLRSSVSTKCAAAAIMIDGIVNPTIVPYKMDGILAAFKAACPHIIFLQDEEA